MIGTPMGGVPWSKRQLPAKDRRGEAIQGEHMKAMHRCRRPTGGFTTIELLVIIAIIGLLLGLLLSAIIRTRVMQPSRQNEYDIKMLSEAVDKFKNVYGFYPPSKILLSNDPSQYGPGGTQLGQATWAVFKKMWPRLDLNKPSFYDWSNGAMAQAGLVDVNGKYAVILEGDQCLVFFLGGVQVQDPKGCMGWAEGSSEDPKGSGNNFFDPLNLILDQTTFPVTPMNRMRGTPFFAFQGDRLYQRSRNAATNAHTFFSYKDAWGDISSGQPFAYFAVTGEGLGATYNDSDCQTLMSGVGNYPVMPYFEAFDWNQKQVVNFDYAVNSKLGRRYWNPTSFQIISAGRDQTFGVGFVPNPLPDPPPPWGKGSTAVTNPPLRDPPPYLLLGEFSQEVSRFAGGPGRDDLTNFHVNVLGAPD
jgi:type II secretory pathway pseudopilin PulG